MNQLGLLNIFKYVSDETNIDVGSLTLFDVSAHIYEINFKDTEKILKLNNYKI
jgi:thymidylate synthase